MPGECQLHFMGLYQHILAACAATNKAIYKYNNILSTEQTTLARFDHKKVKRQGQYIPAGNLTQLTPKTRFTP